MKVTFRCKQSGNTVSFSSQDDIDSMRKEPEYEEVKHQSTQETNHAVQQEIQGQASSEEVIDIHAVAHEHQAIDPPRRGRKSKSAEFEVI